MWRKRGILTRGRQGTSSALVQHYLISSDKACPSTSGRKRFPRSGSLDEINVCAR